MIGLVFSCYLKLLMYKYDTVKSGSSGNDVNILIFKFMYLPVVVHMEDKKC